MQHIESIFRAYWEHIGIILLAYVQHLSLLQDKTCVSQGSGTGDAGIENFQNTEKCNMHPDQKFRQKADPPKTGPERYRNDTPEWAKTRSGGSVSFWVGFLRQIQMSKVSELAERGPRN